MFQQLSRLSGVPSPRWGPGRLRALSVGAALLIPLGAAAQQDRAAPPTSEPDTVPAERVVSVEAVNVTVTRGAREVFSTPAAVSVVSRTQLAERVASGPADLLAEAPGIAVEGVGKVRRSPVVRGMRGQRVLLLEDGVRFNNPRREVDRGEPLALADLGSVDRIEVVRGPASVLYGSDAIGGVVNLISTAPPTAGEAELRARIDLLAGSIGNQKGGTASAQGRLRGVGFQVAAAGSRADAYLAPAGRFGAVRLTAPTPVHDSGFEDARWSGRLALRAPRGDVLVRHERYRVDETGFGYVDPAVLGGGTPLVRIHMPGQAFSRTSLSYRGVALRSLLADRMEATLFLQTNRREMVTEVVSPMAPPAPAGASVSTWTRNHTALSSAGTRVEAGKLLWPRLLLTYGFELTRDVSRNSDTSTTTVTGFGAPRLSGRGVSRVPNATLTSTGWFGQAEMPLTTRTELTAGVRYQRVEAQSDPTDGWPVSGERHSDRALVGAVSLLRRVGDRLNLVASVARGFRSPNLVERFYSGPTPDGRGIWLRNPDLLPETSTSLDLGGRARLGGLYVETFLFQNTLHRGIRLVPTGGEVEGRREYRNENFEELRYRGLEMRAEMRLEPGVSLSASHTSTRARNARDAEDRIVDGDRDQTIGTVRLTPPGRPFWAEYVVRSTGERGGEEQGLSPVGHPIPSHRVHDLRAGLRSGRRQQVVLEVTNLTNRLYAESANTAVFRPAPGRGLGIRWSMEL